MAAFPQILLCILAVVAIFIFICATLICCLLRFVGRQDYGYYNTLESSNEKTSLLETTSGDDDTAANADSGDTYYGYVKPTLIYQTLDPQKGKHQR